VPAKTHAKISSKKTQKTEKIERVNKHAELVTSLKKPCLQKIVDTESKKRGGRVEEKTVGQVVGAKRKMKL